MILEEQPFFRVLAIYDGKAYFDYPPQSAYSDLLEGAEGYSVMIDIDYSEDMPYADDDEDHRKQIVIPIDDRNVYLAESGQGKFIGVYVYIDPKLYGFSAPKAEGFVDINGEFVVNERTTEHNKYGSVSYRVSAYLVKGGEVITRNGKLLMVPEEGRIKIGIDY